MNSTKEHIVDIHLELLPGYADFLLSQKLPDFVKTLYKFSLELEVPLLKFFDGMSESEILNLSTDGNTKLLTALKTGAIARYVEDSKNNWLRNQLPVISKDDVIVEDISLINFARKRALREYLQEYTENPTDVYKILDEIDRFILTLESVSFKTYLTIQQDKLNESTNLLRKREAELLEAQSLAKIGSFEWDMTGNKKSRYTPEVFKIFEFEETSNLEAFLNDVHPEDRLKVQAAIEKAFHDGFYECEYRYSRRNKNKVIYSKGKVIFDQGKAVRMVGTISDVTEKAALIYRLTENEELSKQAQALTNTGSWKWSVELDTIEWSDEMYRIYGLQPQSEKITFQRFLTFIHDEDRNRRIAEIAEAIRTGEASDYIMRINAQDGKEKVLKGKGQVIKDKTGKSIGMLGTC
ncbi:MAG TPA: PAS domain-containing protein, partial [Chryseosolibacter sp.]|nr:PAS domain-containing protein [Chryseosolibacter sp.]